MPASPELDHGLSVDAPALHQQWSDSGFASGTHLNGPRAARRSGIERKVRVPAARSSLSLCALVLGAVLCAQGVPAQELNPRAYVITPTGSNAFNLAYTYLAGHPDVAGAAPITEAEATVDLAALGYYRSFGLLGRSANLALAIPIARDSRIRPCGSRST